MDKLDKLKNRLATNVKNREIVIENIEKEEIAISDNERKLQNKVSVLLEKERLEIESYKELVIGSVDRLNHQMQINNKKVEYLGDSLSDLSDLKSLYEEKNRIMRMNHEELKKVLKTEENDLISKNKKLLVKIMEKEQEYNELSLKTEFKKNIDKVIVIIIIVMTSIIIGSWLGLGFVSFLQSIIQGIKNFFTFN